ncbi:MAG TPA: PAS domain S-box protein, partial [Burkholderiales bacterium]|nr:PAS domain S-box protein [Burkholderiales bacterium]
MHKDASGSSITDFEAEALAAVPRPQIPADPALAGALSGLSKSLERLAAAAQDMRGQTQALAGARKQAEEERRHYQQLFESAPDGYFVTDAEGVIVQANNTAARLLWIDLERLIGRSLSAFVITADRQRFRALVHRLKDPDFARRGRDWEIRFKSPCQPGFTGALNATCEHDEAGRLQALRWLVRDVSERKRAEAALKTREREQRAVAELGRIALTGAPFDALAAEAVALAARVLNTEYGALLQLLPAGQGFVLANGVGWKTELMGKATLAAETDGLWGFTLAADQPVCVEDAQTERRFRWPALLREHGARSGVTVIVRGREHPRGLLGAYGAKRARFSSDDVNFLRSVANVLAAALERTEAERALAKREAEIRLLIDSVPAMIAYVDSSRHYQYHN